MNELYNLHLHLPVVNILLHLLCHTLSTPKCFSVYSRIRKISYITTVKFSENLTLITILLTNRVYIHISPTVPIMSFIANFLLLFWSALLFRISIEFSSICTMGLYFYNNHSHRLNRYADNFLEFNHLLFSVGIIIFQEM